MPGRNGKDRSGASFSSGKTTLGLLIHIQALLLARHLRGDLDCYPPFIGK